MAIRGGVCVNVIESMECCARWLTIKADCWEFFLHDSSSKVADSHAMSVRPAMWDAVIVEVDWLSEMVGVF